MGEERGKGAFEQEQWEEALLVVKQCSLYVAQPLLQLYLLLWVHYAPARMFHMSIRENPMCTRCSKDRGDLIHLMWRCPKLHRFWKGVIAIINQVFQVHVPEEPKQCLLGILCDLPVDDVPKKAIN